MKRSFQIVIALFIAFYSFSTVYAQENTGITFSMMKKNGKLINSDAQGQKVLNFNVSELNTKEEIDAFIAKFEKMEKVVDITIAYDLFYSRRIGSATFKSDATSTDMKNAMLNSGVTLVIINEKTIKIADVTLEEPEIKTKDNTTK